MLDEDLAFLAKLDRLQELILDGSRSMAGACGICTVCRSCRNSRQLNKELRVPIITLVGSGELLELVS
ncbi:MAG: hypothetical protein IH991_17145 [Planctomycetes bacterium]|nr:hypothetical protein [Planctomycetota bacterium]